MASPVNEPVSDDIRDVPSLMKALKHSRIDREKSEAVENFIENGGDELYYLGECVCRKSTPHLAGANTIQMPDIMSSFVFQASRRALLARLRDTFNDASKHREEHAELGTHENDDEKKHIDNILSAVKAADEQVRRLEYWSDVRDMAESKHATDEHDQWQRFHDSESKEIVPTGEESQGIMSRALAVKGKGKEKVSSGSMIGFEDYHHPKDQAEHQGIPNLDKGKAKE
jgi:hypothetical protein